MEIYDKEQLKIRTSQFKFHKNIEVKKHYLFEVLLKSMRHYRDKKNELFNSILEIDILIEKGLHNLAFKRLKASKKVTVACDQFLITYQLLEKELILSRYITSIDVQRVINEQQSLIMTKDQSSGLTLAQKIKILINLNSLQY